MRHVSARDFQLNAAKYLKELPIILTNHNLPVASVVPYKKYQGIKLQKEVNEAPEPHTSLSPFNPDIKVVGDNPNWEVKVHNPITRVAVSRCEAPNTSCRNEGEKYKIGFMTDEGIKKKELYLCSSHLQKARSECESVETV